MTLAQGMLQNIRQDAESADLSPRLCSHAAVSTVYPQASDNRPSAKRET